MKDIFHRTDPPYPVSVWANDPIYTYEIGGAPATRFILGEYLEPFWEWRYHKDQISTKFFYEAFRDQARSDLQKWHSPVLLITMEGANWRRDWDLKWDWQSFSSAFPDCRIDKHGFWGYIDCRN